MEILNILLARYSSGGEALFVGGLIGIFTALLFWLVPKMLSSGKEITREILINTNPDNVKYLLKKANDKFYIGKYDEAVDCMQKVLQIEPDHPEALAYLTKHYHYWFGGKNYVKSKKYLDAYFNSSRESSDSETRRDMEYIRGHHYFLEGDLQKAKTCKEKALNMKGVLSRETIERSYKEHNLY